MAYYYMKNATSTVNVSVADIYKLKGRNLDSDKTNNFYLGAWKGGTGNTVTQSSYPGHAINPWHSARLGIAGTNYSYAGMMPFNSPSQSSGGGPDVDVEMGLLRNYNYRYIPYDFGAESLGEYRVTLTGNVGEDTIDDAAQAPGYAFTPQLCWYTIDRRDTDAFEMYGANWLGYNRRSTTSARFSVGYTDFTGNVGNGLVTEYTVYSTSDLSGVGNGIIGMLNKNQGAEDPAIMSTGITLGSSAPGVFIYRNTSNTGRYSILSLNYAYSGSTPQISVGTNAAISGAGGSEIFSHGKGINMGRGLTFAAAHRGANWLKIYYVKWQSGTTATSTGAPTIVSLGATTTIQNSGRLVRLSDELALWIGPTRNGASSGNSRRLIAHSIYNNSGVPAVRGSSLDTYDWGTTTTATAASAVGDSDRDDDVMGLTVFGRSDTARMNFIGWTYIPSTDSFTFDSSNLITDSTPYQTNSYRFQHNVIHLGYNPIMDSNYYHVAVGGDAGDYILIIEQNVSSGTLTITDTYAPGSYMGTAVRRSQHVILGAEDAMPWFINQAVNGNYNGYIHIPVIYNDTSNYCKIGGVYYNLPGL
jgi:hypothetical protein